MSEGQLTPFVILCLGRSGSTHLTSLLDSHPSIRCFGELFNERNRDPAAFVNSDSGDEPEYLGEVLSGTGMPVAGFKLPYNSIRSHPRSVEAIHSIDGLKVIRLSRGNPLEQLVSRRLLAETGVSHSVQGSYGDATVEIDPRKAIFAFERMQAHESELDEIAGDRPLLRITYEELVAEQRLGELQEFLGVEPVELRSWFERMRTRPMNETVRNWDELRRHLAGTRWERFLQEESTR